MACYKIIQYRQKLATKNKTLEHFLFTKNVFELSTNDEMTIIAISEDTFLNEGND